MHLTLFPLGLGGVKVTCIATNALETQKIEKNLNKYLQIYKMHCVPTFKILFR